MRQAHARGGRVSGHRPPVLAATWLLAALATGGSVANGAVGNDPGGNDPGTNDTGTNDSGANDTGANHTGSSDTGGRARDTCGALPAAHALDFWLGAWEVREADGSLAGTNRIEAALDGCAILEHFSGTDGSQGLGLFYFHSWLGQWRRVWMSAVPQQPGAVKEQRQDLNYRGPGVRFRGEIMVSPEHYVQDRTTLAPLSDGRVHQRVETSNDDGRSWQLVFEGWYRRRP